MTAPTEQTQDPIPASHRYGVLLNTQFSKVIVIGSVSAIPSQLSLSKI